MNITVTGGNGRLGTALIDYLHAQGHTIRSLDRTAPPASPDRPVDFRHVDLLDLESLAKCLEGSEAVIHLAAYPGLSGQPPGEVYRNNTIVSYNLLYAASALGIRRVCLASSINAVGGLYSRRGRFDYFPVDEQHPTYNEDDYCLSKWVLEQQADSFARRFPQMTISSLRFHALPDQPPEPQHQLEAAEAPSARALWGWTLIREAARACELAVQARFTGHEIFFIVAPRTYSAIPSLDLARYAYPEVPIRGDLSGNKSFFDCRKAEKMLGWVHS